MSVLPFPKPPSPRIAALNGARALPPLILVLYHFCEGHGYRDAFWFDMPVGKGYLWVEFFFALSGFILVHVYGPRAGDFSTGKAYFPFLKARLARLYPVHLVTLITMLLLMWGLNALAAAGGYASIYHQPWPPINTGPSFIANLFLVQGWNLFPWLTWNGPSWFVSVEFWLCLLFPLFVLWSRGGVWRALFTLAAATLGLVLLANTTHHGLDLTFENGALRGLADFSAGVALAMLYRRALAAGIGNLAEGWFTVIQIGVLGLIAWAWYGTPPHARTDYWTALALFVLIFAVAFDRGILARALGSRPMRKLGEWSYGIYMGQLFWLQFIRYFEQRFYPPDDALLFGQRLGDLLWWAEPFLLMGVCILWGRLLTKWVEQPAAKALKGKKYL